MTFLQQIIQLLSEPPGNVIYHLVTLFALQVVFAISWGHWRRERPNPLAWRMAWAAGLIFLARAGLMGLSLLLAQQPVTALSLLPPLEYAIHTGTAVLFAWSVGVTATHWPRLGNALAVLLLALVVLMYLSFSLQWQQQAQQGITLYPTTNQATWWLIFQTTVLGVAWLLTFSQRALWFSLRQMMLLLLWLAHLAYWIVPTTAALTQSEIAHWVRLGHLVVFPMWAAFAYLHTLAGLLDRSPAHLRTDSFATTLQAALPVIQSLETAVLLPAAVQFTTRFFQTPFVGIATLDRQNPQHLRLVSNLPQTQENRPRSWNLNLQDWPGLRLAVEEKRQVELFPNGLGARQLREWYQEMGLVPQGALLIQPLLVNHSPIGLLILAAAETVNQWGETEKKQLPLLASYIAQAIDNSYAHTDVVRAAAAVPLFAEPEAGTAVSGRLVALEEERDQLRNEVETLRGRTQQAEIRAVEANKQARDLAATLEELERVNRDEQLETLKAELSSVRESLLQAEEAMALASAGEGGLSPEWVMVTISRYSGQLEEAQARIQYLETELNRQNRREMDEVVVSLIQELRTPMTSITGYTDLLLSETVGILGLKQRDFLQRVKARTEQLETLLGQIVQLTTQVDFVGPTDEPVDVREMIETAVETVLTQLREKNLRLDLEVPYNLPPLPISRKALHQIMTNLLVNACQATTGNGRIAVRAQANTFPLKASDNGHQENFNFLQVEVADSGRGIHVNDLPRVFEPHHRADDPLIAGLGDTGAGLSVAKTLTEAHGGRVWVQSQIDKGTVFSVLFPIPAPEN